MITITRSFLLSTPPLSWLHLSIIKHIGLLTVGFLSVDENFTSILHNVFIRVTNEGVVVQDKKQQLMKHSYKHNEKNCDIFFLNMQHSHYNLLVSNLLVSKHTVTLTISLQSLPCRQMGKYWHYEDSLYSHMHICTHGCTWVQKWIIQDAVCTVMLQNSQKTEISGSA